MNAKYAVVISRYNQTISQGLLEGAFQTFKRHGIAESQIHVLWVPGAFEIPFACQKLAGSKKYNAIIALGCILKGETPHNHYIAQTVTKGLMDLSLELKIPIAFGVLTPNTRAQGIARSGKGSANKGAEAALAAIEMVQIFKPK